MCTIFSVVAINEVKVNIGICNEVISAAQLKLLLFTKQSLFRLYFPRGELVNYCFIIIWWFLAVTGTCL